MTALALIPKKVHTTGRANIVFIHGLTGDPDETWSVGNPPEFWPNWLCKIFPEICVYSLGYPTSIFEKWAKKEMDLHERAVSALDCMVSKGIGDIPTIFIVHSLGGLLLKEILRQSDDANDTDFKKVSDSTRLVVFLATPHTGASLASLAKFVFPRLSSTHIDTLQKDEGFLHALNQSYRNLSDRKTEMRTAVYYEKHKTKNAALVVSRASSDPGVSGCVPVPVDKDHIEISKPSSEDDVVFGGICRHIKNSLKEVLGAKSGLAVTQDGGGYEEVSDTDRRSLLEKMIDAGRETEYGRANNLQNRFARNLIKFGLYTSEKEDQNRLLSEIEQRFTSHIYLPLICKGASESDVAEALQTKVIDPISEKMIGATKFTHSDILSGLYYLTEKCHIRWDAE